MQKGQNQSMTRDINLSLIMRSFIKRPMSRVDISRTFRLSKPAASKITAELEALRLICPGKEEAYPNTPGIKPLNYGLNPKLGVITIIDLSSVTVKIQVYNFRGTILAETCVPDMELIRYDDLVRFTEILQALLDKPELSEYALLSLCVALPCAINKQSDSVEWSPRFDIDPAFNFRGFLRSRFDTRIIVKNDVQLYLLGETYSGLIAEGVKYAVMLYIDAGVGGGFFMNGRLEDGEQGKAGELGFFPFYENDTTFMLDSVASINAIKNRLRKAMADGKPSVLTNKTSFHFRDVKNAYLLDKDPLTVSVIDQTAQKIAVALDSLIKILNINFVVINGRITQLGEGFLQIIRDRLAPQNPCARIEYSKIADTAIKEGAWVLSLEEIVRDKIKTRSLSPA